MLLYFEVSTICSFGGFARSTANHFWHWVQETSNVIIFMWEDLVVLVFPFTWLLFKLGCNPEIYYIVYILDNILLIFVRLFLLKSMVKFPVWRYVNEVLGMVLIVLLVCFILPVSIVEVLPASFGRLILTCIVSFMSTIPTIYYIGMTHSERNTVCNMIKNKLKIRKQL